MWGKNEYHVVKIYFDQLIIESAIIIKFKNHCLNNKRIETFSLQTGYSNCKPDACYIAKTYSPRVLSQSAFI